MLIGLVSVQQLTIPLHALGKIPGIDAKLKSTFTFEEGGDAQKQ